jgi:hypothetical protein
MPSSPSFSMIHSPTIATTLRPRERPESRIDLVGTDGQSRLLLDQLWYGGALRIQPLHHCR